MISNSDKNLDFQGKKPPFSSVQNISSEKWLFSFTSIENVTKDTWQVFPVRKIFPLGKKSPSGKNLPSEKSCKLN